MDKPGTWVCFPILHNLKTVLPYVLHLNISDIFQSALPNIPSIEQHRVDILNRWKEGVVSDDHGRGHKLTGKYRPVCGYP